MNERMKTPWLMANLSHRCGGRGSQVGACTASCIYQFGTFYSMLELVTMSAAFWLASWEEYTHTHTSPPPPKTPLHLICSRASAGGGGRWVRPGTTRAPSSWGSSTGRRRDSRSSSSPTCGRRSQVPPPRARGLHPLVWRPPFAPLSEGDGRLYPTAHPVLLQKEGAAGWRQSGLTILAAGAAGGRVLWMQRA
jgi:hypothetical protein